MGWLANNTWHKKEDVMLYILRQSKNIIHNKSVKGGMILICEGQDKQNYGVYYLIKKDDGYYSYKDISIFEYEKLNNKELKLLDNEYYQIEIKKYKEDRAKEKSEKEKLKDILKNLETDKFYKVRMNSNFITLQFKFKLGQKFYFDKGYLTLNDIKEIKELN